MAITWVLVVHGNAGKILEINKNDKKILVKKEFSHADINKKGHDVYTDRPGRSFESGNPSRHSMSSENLVDHEHKAFAKEIAGYLDKEYEGHKFNRLVAVVSPALLGIFRKEIPESLKKVISHELAKDLVDQGLTNEELIEKIKSDLGVLHLF
jgi:protein required for attachment to host cells